MVLGGWSHPALYSPALMVSDFPLGSSKRSLVDSVDIMYMPKKRMTRLMPTGTSPIQMAVENQPTQSWDRKNPVDGTLNGWICKETKHNQLHQYLIGRSAMMQSGAERRQSASVLDWQACDDAVWCRKEAECISTRLAGLRWCSPVQKGGRAVECSHPDIHWQMLCTQVVMGSILTWCYTLSSSLVEGSHPSDGVRKHETISSHTHKRLWGSWKFRISRVSFLRCVPHCIHIRLARLENTAHVAASLPRKGDEIYSGRD